MNHLPSEILKEIFILLDPNEKVECMTVCQYWKRVIEKFTLYHTIYIFSADTLDSITSIIQTSNNRYKVEQLVVSFYNEEDSVDLSPLLVLLPNLRRFFCTGPNFEDLDTSLSIYPWQNSIEYIHEFSTGPVTYRLLEQGVCPKLTKLIFTNFDKNIVPLLINAPALKSLTLSYGKIGFHDLETVHKCTPQLESITLRSVTFKDDAKVGSMVITPSVSLTECIFDGLRMKKSRLRNELVLYISKKYPNVSKLIYTNYLYDDIDRIEEVDESPLHHLLRNTSSQLTHLYMNKQGYVEKNPFATLDLHHCQIKTLQLEPMNLATGDVVGSQQFSYIEKLSLEDTDVINNFKYYNEFTALKKLKLIGDKYTVCCGTLDLNAILDKTPSTLKSLSLRRIDYSMVQDENSIYPSIESLSFAICDIMPGSKISYCFPHLTKLKIRNCDVPNGSLDLSTMDLFSFRFIWNHDNESDERYEDYYESNDVRDGEEEYLTHYFYNKEDDNHDGIENSILVITKNERRRYAKRFLQNPSEMRFFRLYKVFNSQVISWPERRREPKPCFTFRFNSLKNMTLE